MQSDTSRALSRIWKLEVAFADDIFSLSREMIRDPADASNVAVYARLGNSLLRLLDRVANLIESD